MNLPKCSSASLSGPLPAAVLPQQGEGGKGREERIISGGSGQELNTPPGVIYTQGLALGP